MNQQEKEHLIKEIIYRASRRGTKELDAKFKPFTQPEILHNIPVEKLLVIKDLLLQSEADLMHYLVEGATVPDKYQALAPYLQT